MYRTKYDLPLRASVLMSKFKFSHSTVIVHANLIPIPQSPRLLQILYESHPYLVVSTARHIKLLTKRRGPWFSDSGSKRRRNSTLLIHDKVLFRSIFCVWASKTCQSRIFMHNNPILVLMGLAYAPRLRLGTIILVR